MKVLSIIVLQLLVILLLFTNVKAQTGPGGVGTTDGTSSLKIWYNTTSGVHTTGSLVDSMENLAGISALNISETGSYRPTLVSSAINGIDAISFSGSEMLRTGKTLTTSNFITNKASSFVVNMSDNTTQTSCVYATDPLKTSTRFSNHIPWSGAVYFDIGSCCSEDSRVSTGSLSNLTSYSYWSYDADPNSGKQLYRNGTQLVSKANSSTFSGHSGYTFNIGGNRVGNGADNFEGDVTEVIIFNQKVDSVQRIIIENYLSAKYNITAAASDKYAGDDASNGDYDKNVIGIGTESNGSHTKSSDNKGLIIEQNSGFGNGDYLFAGNALDTNENIYTDIAGVSGLEARWKRIWYFDKTDAGTSMTVDITFDLSDGGYNVNAGVVSNYKLLYRSGTSGNWSDAGTASSVSGDQIIFSNNSLSNGDGYYTIGTLDYENSILSIELISFSAKKNKESVSLNWKTASETNNDYFTIERSANTQDWEQIAQIKGAGNSDDLQTYTFVDKNPIQGINYYRLKQTDFDGKYEYSSTRVIRFTGLSPILIYPNPTSGSIIIEGLNADIQEITVYNALGQVMTSIRWKQDSQSGKISVDFSNFPSGFYYVRIEEKLYKVFKQ